MEGLFVISIILMFIVILIFIGGLESKGETNWLLYRILCLIIIIIFIFGIVGAYNTGDNYGLQRGRIQGSKHPERLHIKSINFETNDTTYVFKTTIIKEIEE